MSKTVWRVPLALEVEAESAAAAHALAAEQVRYRNEDLDTAEREAGPCPEQRYVLGPVNEVQLWREIAL